MVKFDACSFAEWYKYILNSKLLLQLAYSLQKYATRMCPYEGCNFSSIRLEYTLKHFKNFHNLEDIDQLQKESWNKNKCSRCFESATYTFEKLLIHISNSHGKIIDDISNFVHFHVKYSNFLQLKNYCFQSLLSKSKVID